MGWLVRARSWAVRGTCVTLLAVSSIVAAPAASFGAYANTGLPPSLFGKNQVMVAAGGNVFAWQLRSTAGDARALGGLLRVALAIGLLGSITSIDTGPLLLRNRKIRAAISRT